MTSRQQAAPGPTHTSLPAPPLRILVLHNRYRSDSPSGENDVVDSETAALRTLGHDVLLYERSSDEIAQLPLNERLLLPARALRSPRDVRAVLERVAAFRPDVAHVHNLNPLISPAVIPALQAAGVPVVMTVHNFRLACVAGTLFRDGGECRDCLGRRFPAPAVLHGCYRGSRPQSLAMASVLAAHRSTYLSVDRLVALSEYVAGFLRDIGVPASRIAVKPNTVADPGPLTPPGEGFLFAGRMVPEKGARMLVDAWITHGDGDLGRLTLIGDGPDRTAIERVARGRGDIEVRGQVEPSEVAEAMRAHGAVVAPSRWSEAFPRVIAESLAHGRPVLTTSQGSLPEIVGDAGWVAEPTVAGLATALKAAASADLPALAQRARARYVRHYSPAAVYSTLVDVYRDAAADGANRRKVFEQ